MSESDDIPNRDVAESLPRTQHHGIQGISEKVISSLPKAIRDHFLHEWSHPPAEAFTAGSGKNAEAVNVAAANPEYNENFRGKGFLGKYQILRKRLKPFFGAPENAQITMTPGSGTDGIQSVTSSLFKSGDDVVVYSNGFFGNEWLKMAKSANLRVHELEERDGEALKPQHLRDHLLSLKDQGITPKGVFFVDNETSKGVKNPTSKLAQTVKEIWSGSERPLVCIDSVSGIGSHPLNMGDSIDAVLTAPQKALGARAGFWIGCFGERAINRALTNESPVYSLDLGRILKAAPTVGAIKTLNTSLVHAPALSRCD